MHSPRLSAPILRRENNAQYFFSKRESCAYRDLRKLSETNSDRIDGESAGLQEWQRTQAVFRLFRVRQQWMASAWVQRHIFISARITNWSQNSIGS